MMTIKKVKVQGLTLTFLSTCSVGQVTEEIYLPENIWTCAVSTAFVYGMQKHPILLF